MSGTRDAARAAELLDEPLRGRARTELGIERLAEPERPTAPVDPTGPLRAAGSVLQADAVLTAAGVPDWAALAASHRREPFGLPQQRALIARPDCPDALTAALLPGFDGTLPEALAAARTSAADGR